MQVSQFSQNSRGDERSLIDLYKLLGCCLKGVKVGSQHPDMGMYLLSFPPLPPTSGGGSSLLSSLLTWDQQVIRPQISHGACDPFSLQRLMKLLHIEICRMTRFCHTLMLIPFLLNGSSCHGIEEIQLILWYNIVKSLVHGNALGRHRSFIANQCFYSGFICQTLPSTAR